MWAHSFCGGVCNIESKLQISYKVCTVSIKFAGFCSLLVTYERLKTKTRRRLSPAIHSKMKKVGHAHTKL